MFITCQGLLALAGNFYFNVMNNVQQKQVADAIQKAKLDSGISPIGAVLDQLLLDAYIEIVQDGISTVNVRVETDETSLQDLIDNICDIVNILKSLEEQGKIRLTKMDTLKNKVEHIGQLPQNVDTRSAKLPKEVSDWLIEHSSCKIELLNLE